MPDRHLEKPLSLRLGAERQRLEDYARDTGQPVRRVIADAVRAWLDGHASPLQDAAEAQAANREITAGLKAETTEETR